MSFNYQTKIKAIGLSRRTANTLVKNGVNTVQELYAWLEDWSKGRRAAIDGIGATGLREISDFLQKRIDYEKRQLYDSFGSYWRAIQDGRNNEILVEYYNSGAKQSFQTLGDKYQISRARVQQIVALGTKYLQEAYINGIIGDNLNETLDKYADSRTEVHMINIADDYFTGVGIAYLVAAFEASNYKVYTNANLNGEWFIRAEDKIGKVLNGLIDELKHGSEPLLISEIEQLYPVGDNILMSIKGIIEKDGYVTHHSNKVVTGTDRNFIITRYLENVDRPASISEIVSNTILSENQVRGALCDKRTYVNVGKSVYDLVGRDYEGLSIIDLVVNILTAENRALKVENVFKYICRYRTISEQSFLLAVMDAQSIQKHDDYLLLEGWDLDKIKTNNRGGYYITLEDAILEIINNSDELFDFEKVDKGLEKYKGEVSTNPNSIKGTLARLAEKNLIKRVGGARTGCYVKNESVAASKTILDASKLREKATLGTFINANIGKKIEIRYKTKRLNSDKRWRVISVRGQDARYIYTDDLNNNGFRVKYLKDKVVEYREFKPDWYQDVCYCVERLDNVFSLEEVYKFEEELSERHPLNNNIRAKIRQQIQLMMENGLIDRLVPGFYCKDRSFRRRKEETVKPVNPVVSIKDSLIVGKEYRNDELVEIFKVSSQGGMRKSNSTNSLVLIAKHRPDNPYDDKWNGDHFEYTGMGLYGDQSISYMQNKTVAESSINGVTMYLFESYEENSYLYRGIVELDDAPYFEVQKDESGNERKVVKFSLKLVDDRE